jgi:two-component system nitrogen regulation response regulator NtrX
LRQHREDIPDLVKNFLDRIAAENNMRKKDLDAEALEQLMAYDFPGNIRELRNLIERLLIISRDQSIRSADVHRVLPANVKSAAESAANPLLYSKLEDTEKELIQRTLEENHWHISRVARILGLERSHLYKKMKKYGIARP